MGYRTSEATANRSEGRARLPTSDELALGTGDPVADKFSLRWGASFRSEKRRTELGNVASLLDGGAP